MSKPHRTCEGYIDTHYYTHKTTWFVDDDGRHKIRRVLTRSFDTLEEAERFAEGKDVRDIFRSKGRFKVEWIKVTINPEWIWR